MRNEYAGLLIRAYFSRISALTRHYKSVKVCVCVCLCVVHQQQ